MTELVDSPASAGEEYTQIAYSSIPSWARPAIAEDAASPADLPIPAGTSYVLVGIGDEGCANVDTWARAIGDAAPVAQVTHADASGAAAGLRAAVSRSVVGVRVLVSGPAGACLTVRASGVNAGLNDDEIHVTVAGSGAIDVFCSHCRVVNQVVAEVDDVITCNGCARNLLVYYHVSRRTGSYLGYMVDAEEPARAPGTHQESDR
ncbi:MULTISPECIES: dimethylamine monooxygenase subunit DmmA family protein [unclassified Gordonia (in: high G+C Gram-positive bacteria)]|uniref:dimethylamine monooxygenase subunit DmmA family protein n=1 Tax=unclassified Gordonia (in: high G+C Gram-positive bacteria) TaxID=2657482 RepID=UPI001F104BE5|nr:dimethylamine monooxygenase subunit DmmA family protein [Gordonia sp. ABSL49_1]MCH5641308.1 hypothetical protein [Gordonia sp. ABSL49_1]